MNNFIAYKDLLLHKFFKLISVKRYYYNRYGLKCYNKTGMNLASAEGEKRFVDYRELYMGFDALKDKYTLLDTCIDNSPHFLLMNDIIKQKNIGESEYVLRERKGYLDGRFGCIVNSKILNNHIKASNKNFDLVEKNNYEPVIVYKICNRFYIVDGKHRAAICATRKQPVFCKIVDTKSVAECEYVKEIYVLLNKKPHEYQLNIEHIKNILYNMEEKSGEK